MSSNTTRAPSDTPKSHSSAASHRLTTSRYEQVLAHLAHQAAAQQREIRSLRAKVAAAEASRVVPPPAAISSAAMPPVDVTALQQLVSRMVHDCMVAEADRLEDEVGRRMARRVRGLTAQHVQASIDHALEQIVAAPPQSAAKPPLKAADVRIVWQDVTAQRAPVATVSPPHPPTAECDRTTLHRGPHHPQRTQQLARCEVNLAPCPTSTPNDTFTTPLKRAVSDTAPASPPDASSTSALDVSPLAAAADGDAAELSSLTSLSVSTPPTTASHDTHARIRQKRADLSTVSTADSAPMAFLLSVFSTSDHSLGSTAGDHSVPLCDDSRSPFPRGPTHTSTRSSPPAPQVNAVPKRDHHTGEFYHPLSGLSPSSFKALTGDARGRRTESTGCGSASDDVAQLIHLFAGGSVEAEGQPH